MSQPYSLVNPTAFAFSFSRGCMSARLPGPPLRPRRPVRLLYLLAGAAIAILVAPNFISARHTPATGTRPAASVRPAGTQAPSRPPAATLPLTKTRRWMNGLTTLQRRINHALVRDCPITSDLLPPGGQDASQLRPRTGRPRPACQAAPVRIPARQPSLRQLRAGSQLQHGPGTDLGRFEPARSLSEADPIAQLLPRSYQPRS